MEKDKKNHVFPVEKKLADLEHSLKLLNASVTVTHTPLRTLKSMVKGNMVQPIIEKIVTISRL